MSQAIEALRSADRNGPDGLPAWAWLWLPLGLAAALVAVPRIDSEFYDVWLNDEETGLLELAHVVLPLWAMAVAARMLFMPQMAGRSLLRLWVGLAFLGSLYVAGEEASWGQHWFGWQAPAGWAALNDQAETNLHNVSSWLDQKPRALLELGVIVGGIAVPILALFKPGVRQGRASIILPPLLCLPSAALAEFSRLSERALDLAGGDVYLFYRASEVQETYFLLFVLLYVIVLRRRLVALPARRGAMATPAGRT